MTVAEGTWGRMMGRLLTDELEGFCQENVT